MIYFGLHFAQTTELTHIILLLYKSLFLFSGFVFFLSFSIDTFFTWPGFCMHNLIYNLYQLHQCPPKSGALVSLLYTTVLMETMYTNEASVL